MSMRNKYLYFCERSKTKMREQLKQIQAKAEEALSNVLQSKDLDEIKVKFLGKKGELTAILKGMKDL